MIWQIYENKIKKYGVTPTLFKKFWKKFFCASPKRGHSPTNHVKRELGLFYNFLLSRFMLYDFWNKSWKPKSKKQCKHKNNRKAWNVKTKMCKINPIHVSRGSLESDLQLSSPSEAVKKSKKVKFHKIMSFSPILTLVPWFFSILSKFFVFRNFEIVVCLFTLQTEGFWKVLFFQIFTIFLLKMLHFGG